MDEFQKYTKISEAIGFTDFTPHLIQYNGVKGLEDMLTSQELWFGDLAGMNDTIECDHFIDAISNQLGELFGAAQVAAIQSILTSQKNPLKVASYASSWCEYDEGSLSDKVLMWQCYPKEAPIGIVIDSSQFQPSAINAKRAKFYVMSTRINYIEPNDAREVIKADLTKLAGLKFLEDELHNPESIAKLLIAKSPCVKTTDFAHEKEIRFLFSQPLLALMERQYPEPLFHLSDGARSRKFLKFPLKNYSEFDLDFSIKRVLKKVVIGPGANQDVSEARVRCLLQEHDLANVEVARSKVPYAP